MPINTFAQTDAELEQLIKDLTSFDINTVMSPETVNLFTYEEKNTRDTFRLNAINDKLANSPLLK